MFNNFQFGRFPFFHTGSVDTQLSYPEYFIRIFNKDNEFVCNLYNENLYPVWISAEMNCEINEIPELEFTIPLEHSLSSLCEFPNIAKVYDKNNTLIESFFILPSTKIIDGVTKLHRVYCKGLMHQLDNEIILIQTIPPNSQVHNWLNFLFDQYTQLSNIPIRMGYVDDSFRLVSVEIDAFGKSFLEILEQLREAAGGIMYVSPEDFKMYWIKDFNEYDIKIIASLDRNLTGIEQHIKYENLCNRVLAFGEPGMSRYFMSIANNEESQSIYGIRQKVIVNKDINSRSQLQVFANNYVAKFGVPAISYSVKFVNLPNMEVKLGDYVIIENQQLNTQTKLQIVSIKLDLASPLKSDITLGERKETYKTQQKKRSKQTKRIERNSGSVKPNTKEIEATLNSSADNMPILTRTYPLPSIADALSKIGTDGFPTQAYVPGTILIDESDEKRYVVTTDGDIIPEGNGLDVADLEEIANDEEHPDYENLKEVINNFVVIQEWNP